MAGYENTQVACPQTAPWTRGFLQDYADTVLATETQWSATACPTTQGSCRPQVRMSICVRYNAGKSNSVSLGLLPLGLLRPDFSPVVGHETRFIGHKQPVTQQSKDVLKCYFCNVYVNHTILGNTALEKQPSLLIQFPQNMCPASLRKPVSWTYYAVWETSQWPDGWLQ